MVLHNPNNWHWVTKDVLEWTRTYLDEDLKTIKAEEDGVTAQIDGVTSCEGDAEVSQRKGKVITIFDVSLSLDYSGKNKDGQEATGTIKIPELMHDTEPHELQFEITLYAEAEEKVPVKDLVRAKILPQIREHLKGLPKALITEHGKNLQHAPDSNVSSGFSTPKYISNSSINKSGPKMPTASMFTSKKYTVNVTTLTDSSEYRTTAEELFTTFTDPQRLTAFTRSAPLEFGGATPGGKFALFGGNVSGEFVELEKPTLIVQKWRLGQWPEGHFSTMKIRFEQNNVDAVTVMRVDWEGVPAGQEEVTKRNWGEYYVRSIKTTFGFGSIL